MEWGGGGECCKRGSEEQTSGVSVIALLWAACDLRHFEQKSSPVNFTTTSNGEDAITETININNNKNNNKKKNKTIIKQ